MKQNRRKFKKIKAAEALTGLKEAVMEKAVGVVVTIIFILMIFVLTRAFLYRSDYFRLRTIDTRCVASEIGFAPSIKYDELLKLYKGRNLFSVNLKNIVRFFEDAYPDAKEITANIVLPDKITVYIKCRWPVAFLKGERAYIIDDEGCILSGMYGNSSKNLPVIEGISVRSGEKVGRRFVSANLKNALDLLKELRRDKIPARYGVTKIDARDPRNLSFYLTNGIEVRIGAENFRDRIKVFEKTIRDPRLVPDKIEYIDVRFDDAVIGPK